MYYIIFPILYLLSLLPWRILYIISNGIYLLLYYVIGYRKEVVMNNLKIAFPEKSETAIKQIAKQFYKNFTDTFIETLKLISITENEFKKRCSINAEVINDLRKTNQSIQIHTGHFFNWEYLNLGCASNLNYKFIGIYKDIASKTFERIMFNMRKKFGTVLISVQDFKTRFHNYNKEPYSIGLVADQNPGNLNKAYWLPFFGKMAPFYAGPEKGAIYMNTAVVMLSIHKIKRGYYHLNLELLTTTPKDLPKGYITKKLIEFIENEVKKEPANYLWSHRRWKHEFDAEKYGHLVL